MTKTEIIKKVKSIFPGAESKENFCRSSNHFLIKIPHHRGNVNVFFEKKKDDWDVYSISIESESMLEWWRKLLC